MNTFGINFELASTAQVVKTSAVNEQIGFLRYMMKEMRTGGVNREQMLIHRNRIVSETNILICMTGRFSERIVDSKFEVINEVLQTLNK